MVSVRGLSHRFEDRPVLRGIDLEIAPGEIVAIMGSSGGGKTTLLRCISGLITPTEGHVLVDGVDVREDPEEARRRMGMVFQSAALFDYMNVEDNILFGIRRRTRLSLRDQRALVKSAMHRLAIDGAERKFPAELSGGMRKRVGIARAVALGPKLMLYDEPTTGLDPITTYSIDALIVGLRKALGVTSLIVSHDVSSVFRVADRVAFLHAGQLTFVGSVDEFMHANEEHIQELVQKSAATSFEEFGELPSTPDVSAFEALSSEIREP